MTEEKDKRKFMVGGYEFTSKEDAQIAKDELNAIKICIVEDKQQGSQAGVQSI